MYLPVKLEKSFGLPMTLEWEGYEDCRSGGKGSIGLYGVGGGVKCKRNGVVMPRTGGCGMANVGGVEQRKEKG